eukprot:Pgem_evm1s9967
MSIKLATKLSQHKPYSLSVVVRMKNAKICVYGTTALSAEACKNIVLAGIGKLVIVENSVCEQNDLWGNFLLSHDKIGEN